MPIISDAELVSYLRLSAGDSSTALFASMADELVTEYVGTLTSTPVRVKAIALEVAARAYRNPDGYSSETVDDYTYRRDAATRQAGIYLTATERADLLSLAGGDPSTVYTIPLGGPDVWR